MNAEFEGDADRRLMRLQGETFHDSCPMIVREASHAYEHALQIIGHDTELWKLFGTVRSYQPRLFDGAYAILAARYRLLVNPCPGDVSLPLYEDADEKNAWIRWLWKECAALSDHGEWVRGVLGCAAYQDTELGWCCAESLTAFLRSHYEGALNAHIATRAARRREADPDL